MAATKLCKRHNHGKGAQLKRDEFPKDKKRTDGLSDWCKQCWKDYRVEKASGSGKKAKSVKQVREAIKSTVRSQANSKSKKQPAQSVKPSEQVKVVEKIPAGITVRDIKPKDLPKNHMLVEWVGLNAIEEKVAAFTKKHGFKPTVVLRFGTKHWIETKVPAMV